MWHWVIHGDWRLWYSKLSQRRSKKSSNYVQEKFLKEQYPLAVRHAADHISSIWDAEVLLTYFEQLNKINAVSPVAQFSTEVVSTSNLNQKLIWQAGTLGSWEHQQWGKSLEPSPLPRKGSEPWHLAQEDCQLWVSDSPFKWLIWTAYYYG